MLVQLKQQIKDQRRKASYRRKTRVFGVGMAKSGTHSIGTMFNERVRADHEPASTELLDLIIDNHRAPLPQEKIDAFVRKRVDYLCLDVDSSQLNFFILESLLSEFPDARFLLPIRRPESWLRSIIDDSLRRETTARWMAMRDLRFGARAGHPDEQVALEKRDLHTLDGYLSYWQRHNHAVLDLVPTNRLLVFSTSKISQRAVEISQFCGLDAQCLDMQSTHNFKNTERFGVLDEIDPDYVQSKLDDYFDARLRACFD